MSLTRRPHAACVALLAAAAMTGCQSTPTSERAASGQATFQTPDLAVSTLVGAVGDADRAALRSLFGPRVSELRTDDPDRSAEELERFADQLAHSARASTVAPLEAEVLIGPDSWPFAVPLVSDGAVWWFDTDTGIDELISRRIGTNELKTIDACRTLIDAQRAYFAQDRDADGAPEYAVRLMSIEGTRDGLYWPAPGGVDPSPIGPALAMSATRSDAAGRRIPFWGYRYHLLTAQSAAAPGGALNYSTPAGLTAGWAVVAYPAEYDRTGVMSFMTSHHGVIYEADLGPSGSSTATSMTEFDPNGWSPVTLNP